MAAATTTTPWDQFASVSIKALRCSSRALIGRYLDLTLQTFSTHGYLQDWRGLAELAGLGLTDIQLISERPAGEYTEKVLTALCNRDATIGDVITHLTNMERYDVLEDDRLLAIVNRDVEGYNRDQQMAQQEAMLSESRPLQVDTVSSQEGYVEEQPMITLGDADGRREYFDAFVCYAHEDSFFVRQMVTHVEENLGYKLCLPGRDLMPGTAKYSAIGDLIEHRCRKVIVLLSPEYLKSPECHFQTQFTQSLSPGFQNRKLVPVLIKPLPLGTTIPNVLRCITLIDYTKCEVVDWFWKRLVGCLKETTSPVVGSETRHRLSDSEMLNITYHR